MDKRRGTRGGHAAPRRGRTASSPRTERERRVRLAGWIFLGITLAAAVAALILLLPGRKNGGTEPLPSPVPAAGPGSAFATDATAPPLTRPEGTGGREVDIRAIHCSFEEPAELTVGILESVDLSALAESACANAAAHGWGDIVWSVSENGDLVLRPREQTVLAGSDFEKQEAFLASAQPENLARTFLDHSGILPLLREYGLDVSLTAENDQGMITFRGSGAGEQEECYVRFSFLYSGAFNQAVVHAVRLEKAVTTTAVVPLRKAVERAVTWSSADSGATAVADCRIRSVRGIPFYVLGCEDGTVAYALAVEESALGQVPGAEALYREMMEEGIQEYVAVPGAAY